MNFLLNHNSDNLCLDLFWNFQSDVNLEKHKKLCQNYGHCNTETPEKFKPVIDKDINIFSQVPANISKYRPGTK